jgi:predicted nucleic acid-binding protein
VSGPPSFVVDASVGIKLVVVEDLSDAAMAIFSHLAATPRPQYHVPDLFYVECANILWKRMQRWGSPLAEAKEAIAFLRGLALVSAPTADLAADALAIAAERRITAYDACYVALSRRLGIPLVTADEKLRQKLAGSTFDIRRLADLDVTPFVAR